MASLGFSSMEEQERFIDMIAQAVIDKIEERERVNRLADIVVMRVLALQQEEAALLQEEKAAKSIDDDTKASS